MRQSGQAARREGAVRPSAARGASNTVDAAIRSAHREEKAISDQLSRIQVRHRASGDPARLAWAIRAARSWLGSEVEPAPEGMRRYAADLRLRVSDHPALVTFGKAAYVDVGELVLHEHGWRVPFSWRASSLAPLFPVFSGSITARGNELTLSGWYAPPGGPLGRAADRALLHIAAEGTARWLLGQLDEAAVRGAA